MIKMVDAGSTSYPNLMKTKGAVEGVQQDTMKGAEKTRMIIMEKPQTDTRFYGSIDGYWRQSKLITLEGEKKNHHLTVFE